MTYRPSSPTPGRSTIEPPLRSVLSAALGVVVVAAALAVGCASAPTTRPAQNSLEAQSDAVIAAMAEDDPTLGAMLSAASGYVVLPEVFEGGLVGAGAAGVGVVYEDHEPIGYLELNEGSIGAQAGAQSFSMLIVFRSPEALDRAQAGNLDLTADASTTLVSAGAAASAPTEHGTAIFLDNEAGLMLEASLGAQSWNYVPRRR